MKLTSGTNLKDRKLRRKWILKRGGLGLGLGLTISIIILWTIYGILHLIGFASYGIVKGSWAAEEESIIMKNHHGKIPENSWFRSNFYVFHRSIVIANLILFQIIKRLLHSTFLEVNKLSQLGTKKVPHGGQHFWKPYGGF